MIGKITLYHIKIYVSLKTQKIYAIIFVKYINLIKPSTIKPIKKRLSNNIKVLFSSRVRIYAYRSIY